ncbi:putative FAD dependent oxidoreductase [Plectosphaerella plurivora]|uniref:FAD dependent oxidoreductase n=1 Tax=Plectosphaerella plurivora TaxID=936078 RepID=A0A9P9AAQ7_9PEZI|nr:putative FAD dependent oxidoreductase [Plectosphaerella plurivora]
MSPLSIRTLVLAAGSAAIITTLDVVAKDVVVTGGRASGAYTTFRLREDYGQSITLIKKEEALGGYIDSWIDPETSRTYDTGVVTFIDTGNATSFIERLGLNLGTIPRALVVLDKFRIQAERFKPLIQAPSYFNFPKPEDIPDKLLILFSDTGLGLGSFIPASLRNQDIYDAITDVLSDDIYYYVSVLITFITAKRLLISIPPTEKNTAPFDLNEEETEVLGKIEYNNLYTGLIDNSATPDNYFILPEAPFTARINTIGDGSHFRVTFISDSYTNPYDAKAIIQRDFNKLIKAGVIATAGDSGDNKEIKAGFFQRFNALQGLRST